MHYNIAAMGWLPQWVGCCNGLVAALGWLLQWVGCCNGLVAAMGWLLQWLVATMGWVGCCNGLYNYVLYNYTKCVRLYMFTNKKIKQINFSFMYTIILC